MAEVKENLTREHIEKGLAEANNILYFNKKGDGKSRKIIEKAIENLDKETWHSRCNKDRCKQKLARGLTCITEQTTYVEKEKKNQRTEQTKLGI